MSKMKIISIVLGYVFACGFICGGIFLFDSIRNRNVEVEATVISVEEIQEDFKYTVEYEYTYKKRTYRSSVESFEIFDVGTRQSIKITKNDPNRIYKPGDDFMAVGIYMFIGLLALFLIGVGIVFLIIMIVITIRAYCKRNKNPIVKAQ